MDGVTSVPAGDPATVTATFDGSNVHFTFGIPRGADGTNGTNGTDGAQGPPGEVTNAQLDAAVAGAVSGSSANTNAVMPFSDPISDPPTKAEVDAVVAKLNELINALHR